METLSEFLKSHENQSVLLGKFIELFRKRGEWGKRGLFATIGKETGFSPAYVGQVFAGKKPLTDKFVEQMAAYLDVTVLKLRGGDGLDSNRWGNSASRVLPKTADNLIALYKSTEDKVTKRTVLVSLQLLSEEIVRTADRPTTNSEERALLLECLGTISDFEDQSDCRDVTFEFDNLMKNYDVS